MAGGYVEAQRTPRTAQALHGFERETGHHRKHTVVVVQCVQRLGETHEACQHRCTLVWRLAEHDSVATQ